jgi:hypothetical protein
MQPSANAMDLWKRAAPGLMGGLCILASSTTMASSHVDKPPLFRESGWPGSDSTSASEALGGPGWPESDFTSASKEHPRLRYEETSSGPEEPSPGPAYALQLTLTRNETDEPNRLTRDETDELDRREQNALEALESLEEYSADDWDMEGARAISPEVIKIAASLLQRLPKEAASPDVAPAADGTVCMEWVARSGLLWLDLGSDRTAWMLTKIDGQREEKRLPVDGKDFRMALERLYPPKREKEKGFWAFSVAA